jgi:hypothetical protein
MASFTLAIAPRVGGDLEKNAVIRFGRERSLASCAREVDRTTSLLSPTCLTWTYAALYAVAQSLESRETREEDSYL